MDSGVQMVQINTEEHSPLCSSDAPGRSPHATDGPGLAHRPRAA
jgi:hypothetical protein